MTPIFKDDVLKRKLQESVEQLELDLQREFLEAVTQEMQIDIWDCAAALLYLLQGERIRPALRPTVFRSIRYRLDVGKLHRVTEKEIQDVLVAESGVDRKRIGRIDIRDAFTIVDLPDGMPADIFQVLTETTLGGRRLNIKRIRANRKKLRHNHRERQG